MESLETNHKASRLLLDGAEEPPIHPPHATRGEQVVSHLLRHISLPTYDESLPPGAAADDDDDDWPYSLLPSAARVGGPLPGQIADPRRAQAKQDQVLSMLRCILPLVPSKQPQQQLENEEPIKYTIVDFGGGTGHLSIPLALLLPHCTVVCVDLGRYALQLLLNKAAHCVSTPVAVEDVSTILLPPQQLHATAIPNLFLYHGPVHTYTQRPLHLAVALHLCGEATDVVLRVAAAQQATIIVAPCCVGKLATTSGNPYVFQATGQNAPTIAYPQSRRLRALLDKDAWNALAQAADAADLASNPAAKSLLEMDRALFLHERYGYRTVFRRLAAPTPKRDVLISVPLLGYSNPNDDDDRTTTTRAVPEEAVATNSSDEAADAIQAQLRAWMEHPNSHDDAFVFPTGQGAQQRKCIHQQAERLGLRHWGVGKKNAEKTVAVAIRTNTIKNNVL